MPVSRETVLAALAPDEIDYPAAAAHLGPDALPILMELIDSADPAIAPKATYLAAAVAGVDPAAVFRVAADSPDPVVRIAAAQVAAQLDRPPVEVLGRLLEDQDVGVRKNALATAGKFRADPEIRERLASRANEEPQEELRSAARRQVG